MAEFGPCRTCGLPVLPDQPRYTVPELSCDPPEFEHWDCHEKKERQFRTSVQRLGDLSMEVQAALKAVKRRLL